MIWSTVYAQHSAQQISGYTHRKPYSNRPQAREGTFEYPQQHIAEQQRALCGRLLGDYRAVRFCELTAERVLRAVAFVALPMSTPQPASLAAGFGAMVADQLGIPAGGYDLKWADYSTNFGSSASRKLSPITFRA